MLKTYLELFGEDPYFFILYYIIMPFFTFIRHPIHATKNILATLLTKATMQSGTTTTVPTVVSAPVAAIAETPSTSIINAETLITPVPIINNNPVDSTPAEVVHEDDLLLQAKTVLDEDVPQDLTAADAALIAEAATIPTALPKATEEELHAPDRSTTTAPPPQQEVAIVPIVDTVFDALLQKVQALKSELSDDSDKIRCSVLVVLRWDELAKKQAQIDALTHLQTTSTLQDLQTLAASEKQNANVFCGKRTLNLLNQIIAAGADTVKQIHPSNVEAPQTHQPRKAVLIPSIVRF